MRKKIRDNPFEDFRAGYLHKSDIIPVFRHQYIQP